MEIEQLKTFSYILNSENVNETFEIIRTISNEDELFVLLDNYNWDNGFEVPTEILNNPHCTLSTALLAFYRADGFRYLSEGDSIFKNRLTKDWEIFLKSVLRRILNKEFPLGDITFNPELTKIQKFKLKKLNPELDPVLIDGIQGKDLNIII
ncbi:hypothetical protein STRDD11_02446 [Streptococcus sp. DD11]|uniref:DUF4274 domain-containing protein n=1 Tax=Streptococcus sp. DD11 TaxID=1777879 RepID=UPI0007978239|nr:DUF4274 domain-containing protein [Streptococcus sp. DD11]KXT78286.1 hypothetical protein STRDD11_02446 [Streptococcus sp. DD11]